MQKTARAVREAFLEMERRNKAAIAKTGEIDAQGISAVIETAVADSRIRSFFILALAEFIGTALDGTVIELANWDPFR